MANCNFRACEECTQRCFSIHDGHGNISSSSSVVPSFFKFFHGDTCLEKLLIPPNFARTIISLVDQKVHLEDSKGKCWDVEVSSDGSFLFFHQGWHQFAVAHSLKRGQFLVFNYPMRSHFEVKVYGTSGSEKLNFSNRESEDATHYGNGNSRKTCSTPEILSDNVMVDSEMSSPPKATPPMTEKSVVKGQGSYNTSVHSDSSDDIIENECIVPIIDKTIKTIEKATPQTVHNDYTEVPFYMIGRDSQNLQEANRSCLFDLSDYEMVNTGSGVGRNDKVVAREENRKLPPVAIATQPETGPQVHCFREDRVSREESVDTTRKRKRTPLDFIGTELGGDSLPVKKIQPPTDKTSTCNSASEFKRSSCDSVKVPLFQDTYSVRSTGPQQPQSTSSTEYPQKPTGHQEKVNEELSKKHLLKKQKFVFSGMDVISQVKPNASARKSGAVPVITKELPGLIEKNYPSGSKLGVVKSEPQDMSYPSRKLQGQATRIVKTENVDCFDDTFHISEPSSCSARLVTRSYLEFSKNSQTLFSGRKMRMDRKIVFLRDPAGRVWPILYQESSGLRVLASGWKSLADMNNIQEGDQCMFEVENEGENLYRVRLNRKAFKKSQKMRREGRQHGMVRTCMILPSPLNPNPNTRVAGSMSGLYTKVTSKPTNHSKFTGKCGTPRCDECHSHPVCKSKSKAKGSKKLKSCDVVKNHKLINWRVVDQRDDDYLDDEVEDEDYGDDGNVLTGTVVEENSGELPVLTGIVVEDVNGEVEIYEDVGFVLEQVEEDEDWCLVGEV